MPNFVNDVEEIRARAERKIDEGAVTETYEGDAHQTVSILNEALATEIVCVLRYMHHYFMATGVHGMAVRDEFKEHADAEREHADEIAERIQQLGGKPDFNPASLLQRSVSQYVEGETLSDMIREDLIAERIVIEVYQKMIRHFADHDPTTRVMIEHILRDEEEHASDLSDLLFIVDPRSGETEGEDPGTHPLNMHRDEQSRQQRNSKSSPNKGVPTAKRESVSVGRGEAPSGTPKKALGADVKHDPGAKGHHNDVKLGEGNIATRNPGGEGERDLEGDGVMITNQGDKGQTRVVKGREKQQTSGRGDVNTPEHQPGATGRPMNRRSAGEDGDLDTGNPGSMSGTNKSSKLTNKGNRKKRAA
jgi:bacterioferritin